MIFPLGGTPILPYIEGSEEKILPEFGERPA